MLRKLTMLLAAITVVMAAQSARADDGITLKIGTLAPAESPWGQVFKIWS